MKLKYIALLLLMLPVFSACNQEDDVIDIFTGKRWKLNFIVDSKNKNCIDSYFTGVSAEVKQASMDKMENLGNFVIDFTGVEVDGEAIGTYSGRATNTTISGNWQANGKSNAFSTDQGDPSNNEDLLGKVFIKAFKTAYKYEGDTAGNLTIYFEDEDRKDKRALILFVVKE